MALTVKDIILIKEALQPQFTKAKSEIVHIVINEVKKELKNLEEKVGKRFNQVEMRFNQVEERFNKVEKRSDQVEVRIDLLEVNIENRIQLSEKNIIETHGELHQNHEVRIRRLEKVTHLS